MKGCMKFGCVGFIVIIFISIVASLFSDDEPSNSNSFSSAYSSTYKEEPKLTPEQIREKARQDSIREANASYWRYGEDKDEMTDKITYLAKIESDNRVQFDFPYDGGSTLELVIRRKKGVSKDVYIKISKGQFNSIYSVGGYVTVRFDDKPAKKYSISESLTHDSDVRFLSNESQFIKELGTAKVLKIQADFFQEGSRTFTFKVQNFKAENFK